MRIIGGNLRGKKILNPTDKSTRPLKDIVRESIFNIIEHSKNEYVELNNATVLDLFSGTGSFGIECLSRGAKKVIFYENYENSIKVLKKNLDLLKLNNNSKIIQNDSYRISRSKLFSRIFDLIFLDPPFNESLIQKSLNIISENELLTDKGLVYIECERGLDLESLRTDLTQLKLSRGGETKYCLYES